MADLLELFEPTLQALKATGVRSKELNEQVQQLRTRSEADRTTFEAKSRNLVPRSQALAQKFAKTEGAVKASFASMVGQIRAFREQVQALEQHSREETSRLFQAVQELQANHESLRQAAEDSQQNTQSSVFSHGIEAQARMQQIAPQLEGLDERLGVRIIPSAVAQGKQVGTQTTTLSKHFTATVIPDLDRHTTSLGQKMNAGAEGVQGKAKKVAADLEAQAEALMREAHAAAKRMHEQSNGRLIRLVGEADQLVSEIMSLLNGIQKAMTGLRVAQRRAGGVLDMIMEIIMGLVQLLKDIEKGYYN